MQNTWSVTSGRVRLRIWCTIWCVLLSIGQGKLWGNCCRRRPNDAMVANTVQYSLGWSEKRHEPTKHCIPPLLDVK